MNFYTLTDKKIAKELGHRLKILRLRKNLSQQKLAEITRLSLNTIKSLEQGCGKLTNLIAILRELGALDNLDHFIPEINISPLQLAKMKNKPRQRASAKKSSTKSKDN